MKGLFIPDITSEMFRNGCLEAIEALMAEGDIYDIEYDPSVVQPERKRGKWLDIMVGEMPAQACNQCNTFYPLAYTGGGHRYCPSCGARMNGEQNG